MHGFQPLCILLSCKTSSIKDHAESVSPNHQCCFFVNVSGNINVGKDSRGIIEVSMHADLLIVLALEKHLVIKLK